MIIIFYNHIQLQFDYVAIEITLITTVIHWKSIAIYYTNFLLLYLYLYSHVEIVTDDICDVIQFLMHVVQVCLYLSDIARAPGKNVVHCIINAKLFNTGVMIANWLIRN